MEGMTDMPLCAQFIFAVVAALSLLYCEYISHLSFWPKTLFLVSATVLCSWQLVGSRWSGWKFQASVHTMRVSGYWCGVTCFASILLWYSMWWKCGYHYNFSKTDFAEVQVLKCIQNLVLMTSLANGAHLSLTLCQRWSSLVGLVPIALHVLWLPFNMHDRAPLFHIDHSLLGQGFHHVYMVFSLLCALCVLRCPQLYITLASELRCHVDRCPRDGFHMHFEQIVAVCAILSSVYLLCCWGWLLFGYDAVFVQGLYHVTWSYLRPSYVILFAGYWLKKRPDGLLAQAFLCGVGFVFFSLLCPLTTTGMTYKFDEMSEVWPKQPLIGHASHRLEAISFIMSMALFWAHGISSGQWNEASPSLCRFLTIYGAIFFGKEAVDKIPGLISGDLHHPVAHLIEKVGVTPALHSSFFLWIVFQWISAYACMGAVSLYNLYGSTTAPLNRLSFVLEPAQSEADVKACATIYGTLGSYEKNVLDDKCVNRETKAGTLP
eukprot:TRINITY_DN5440_c0_g1_i4.p1 TRINITY_DN5440_c0_g1~~TRINITY_DN5440_c0_g1_i4.p1  ORF type:complete len:490 (+),score=31.24 TRINITY_DN5440_c0_g1_i4:144-1613(+)